MIWSVIPTIITPYIKIPQDANRLSVASVTKNTGKIPINVPINGIIEVMVRIANQKKGSSIPKIKNPIRSEEHTSELQSRPHLVCRLLLEKKKKKTIAINNIINKT